MTGGTASAGDVLRPTHWWVIAAQPIADRDGWCSALDVAIRTDDGEVRIGGIRTAGWFADHHAGDVGAGGVRTGDVADTDFDPANVHYWDFGRLLWVGPSAAARLVWSNAEALTPAAIATLLHSPGGAAFLAGPTGTGLPTAGQLGIELADDAGEPITVDW